MYHVICSNHEWFTLKCKPVRSFEAPRMWKIVNLFKINCVTFTKHIHPRDKPSLDTFLHIKTLQHYTCTQAQHAYIAFAYASLWRRNINHFFIEMGIWLQLAICNAFIFYMDFTIFIYFYFSKKKNWQCRLNIDTAIAIIVNTTIAFIFTFYAMYSEQKLGPYWDCIHSQTEKS